MPINEYDDIVSEMAKGPEFKMDAPKPTQPAPMTPVEQPAYDFADEVAQMKEESRIRVQESVYVGAKTDPDRSAEYQRISKAMNLPLPLVERNYEQLKGKAKTDAINTNKLIDENPLLSEWLANPDNASIAMDDLGNLKKLESETSDFKFFDEAFNSLASGVASINSNVLKTPALLLDAAAIPGNLIADAAGMPEYRFKSPDWMLKNQATEWADSIAKGSAAQVPALSTDMMEKLGQGDIKSAVRGLTMQLLSNGPNQMLMMGLAMSTGGTAGLAYAGATSAAGKNAELREQGVDPTLAATNAITTGGIEAGFESLGTFGIMKTWEKQIAKTYGKGMSREVISGVAKNILYSMASEGNEEALTSGAQDLTDYITGVNPDALKGIGGRMANAGLLGFASGGAMTAPISIVNARQQVKSAQLAKDYYTSFGESAEASKLRARLPEAQRAFVEQVTKDSPVENIYIPAETMNEYFQSKGVVTANVVNELGIASEFDQAQAAGGDVKIPLATWTEKMVGTEHWQGLADHVRFKEDGLSANEARQALQETQAELARESEQAAEPTEDQRRRESAAQIETYIKDELVKTGVYDEQTAATQARVYEAAFRTLGERSGVDPKELFDRYQLRIQKQEGVEPTADQQAAQGERVLNQGAVKVAEALLEQPSAPSSEKVIKALEIVRAAQADPNKIVLFNSATAERDADIAKYGIVPQHGSWIREVAESTGADVDEILEAAPELAYYDENPAWIFAQISRQVGASKGVSWTPSSELTREDIVRHGQLSVVIVDRTDSDFRKLGEDGASFFDLEGNLIGSMENEIGPEPSNVVTEMSLTPDLTLTGEDLIQFMKANFSSELENFNSQRDGEADRILFQSAPKYGEFQVRQDMPEQVRVVQISQDAATSPEYQSIKAATDFAEDNLRQQVIRNEMTGLDIRLAPGGFNEVRSKSLNPKDVKATAAALVNLPALMRSAVFDANESVEKSKSDVKGFKRFYAPMRIGDTDYTVRIKVKESSAGEQLFYHEVAVENERPAGNLGRQEGLTSSTPAVSGSNEGQVAGQFSGADLVSETSAPAVSDPSSININDFAASINGTRAQRQWFQGGDAARGRIRFGQQRKFTIDLFQSADLSTFLHETGHFYMEVVGDLATAENAPEQLKADFKTMLDWFGVESRDQITVEHHEMWARGFEAYLMTGKAPTSKLRETFARFKVWLLSVYRNVKNLNVELTPEIQDVMARLLATDEEIANAYGKTQSYPLFQGDPSKLGMSDAQAERYNEAVRDAKIASEEYVSKLVMDDYDRQKQAWYKEESEKVREQVTQEISEQPAYRAHDAFLKGITDDAGGVTPVKLDKKEFVKRFGEEAAKAMPRGVFGKEGFGIDIASSMLGFRNAQDLIGTLADLTPKKQAVEAEVKRRMNEKHPDILIDGRLPEEAVNALHNEKRSQLLRMELQHLAANNMPVLKDVIRRVARRVPTDQEIRRQATEAIGVRKVTELKPYLFQRAERKAAMEAGQALAKGDIDAAFAAKRRELLNHELYRATVEANELVKKSEALAKKFSQSDEKLSKSRDIDMVNAGRAILAQYGLGKSDKTAEEYLKQIKAYDPDTYETVIAIVQDVATNPKTLDQVSFDDYVALYDTLKAIWDLSKSNRQMIIDGKIVDKEQIKQELITQLQETGTTQERPGMDRAVSDRDEWKMMYLGVKAALRRVESWARTVDGGEAGAFTKYFVQPVMEATATYRLAQKAQIAKFLEIIKPIKETLTTEDIAAPELGYTFKGKVEILGALLHTGNDSNMEKLLLGRKWGALDAEGNLVRTRWDGFVNRLIREGTITKADFDVVQAIWDLNEEAKPLAQKAHKQMFGFYFNEVTANEFTNALGTFRGGYMPAVVDSRISEDAAIRDDKAALEGGQNSFMFPTTGRGFTKARVQYNAPLMLDMRMVPSHLDKVMRFVHIEPAVKQVSRIVMDKDFRSVLGQYDRAAAQDMLVPWLQRTATQKVVTPGQGQASRALDKVAGLIRSRAGINTMVANTINAVQNFASIPLITLRVPGTKVASHLLKFVRSPKESTAFATEKSDFMKTRVGEQAYDLHKSVDEILLNPSTNQKVKDAAIKHGYVMQIVTQNVMEVTAWTAAYDHAMETMSEKEAIRFADSVVRETQGDMTPEGVSRVETGTAFARLFTQFYGYFNMHGNLLKTEANLVKELGSTEQKMKRGFYVYLMGFAVPAVLAEMIARTLGGSGLDEDDDGEYAIDILSVLFGSQGRMLSAMVPGGAIPMTVINNWNDKAYDDKLSTPWAGAIEKTARAPLSIYKSLARDGSSKTAIQDSLTAIGMLTGHPAAALGRPLGYLADVSEGKQEPTGPVDFARGLATGKGPKK